MGEHAPADPSPPRRKRDGIGASVDEQRRGCVVIREHSSTGASAGTTGCASGSGRWADPPGMVAHLLGRFGPSKGRCTMPPGLWIAATQPAWLVAPPSGRARRWADPGCGPRGYSMAATCGAHTDAVRSGTGERVMGRSRRLRSHVAAVPRTSSRSFRRAPGRRHPHSPLSGRG